MKLDRFLGGWLGTRGIVLIADIFGNIYLANFIVDKIADNMVMYSED